MTAQVTAPATPVASGGSQATPGWRVRATRVRSTWYERFAKRTLDLGFGTVLALLSFPVVVVLAVGVSISLRTSPFFVQRRIGRDGELFRCPKLRTLPPDAPPNADKYAIGAIPTSRFCAFLRRTHLDELPQLVLVPFGYMSLVGPRPEMPELVADRYPPHFAEERVRVRPGCTGLWQLSDESDGLIFEAPHWDLCYSRALSFRLDLWILWRTLLNAASIRFRLRFEDLPEWVDRGGVVLLLPVSASSFDSSNGIGSSNGNGHRAAAGSGIRSNGSGKESAAGSMGPLDLSVLGRRSLVAGAGGFIGGHLVQRMLEQGAPVTAVDVKPLAEWHQLDERATNLVLDLQHLDECHQAVEGASTVYNLAADMGGMGFIEHNKALCMLSVLVNTHLLLAARDARVQRFFYASSACVYAADKQRTTDVTPLAEADAYPAMPEDGYGWEKLFSERMCRHFLEDFGLETRVARYHNVYGPHGTYDGGREKAPAAICRKVVEAVISGSHEIEIWGDGRQTRSFTYIDDCIAGTELLTVSDVSAPVNIGSSQLVSINELVGVVEQIAGVHLRRRYVSDAPQGVRGRNSDNELVKQLFGWEPSIRLEDGLEATYRWIFDQLSSRMTAHA